MTQTRRAGQHARQTHRKLRNRALAALVLIFAAGIAVGAAAGFLSMTFFAAELVVIALVLVIGHFGLPVVERWSRGAAGEEHVGAILDGLAAHGWLTVHDLDTGRGNVDHVVVGPAGVFTVETKSHRGRIAVDSIERRMLSQAYAQAKHVEELIGGPVTPLLVFSRAYLSRPLSRHRGVLVLPARLLAGHLGRREETLDPETVRALHARIAGPYVTA